MATMFPFGPWWPVALGAAIRFGVWALVPASRFASDEGSYFQVGTALAAGGEQDLFWPPLTGWLIALVTAIAGPSVSALRFVWVVFDIGCLLCVRTLASRVAPALFTTTTGCFTRVETVAPRLRATCVLKIDGSIGRGFDVSV